MDRSTFAARLSSSSAAARDFARRFIIEPLPDELVCRVRLNSSYDGNPLHVDERVFPADSTWSRAHQLHRCSIADAVDALWRDGAIPEWIDVSVVGECGDATIVELRCCGRYTENDALLYHARDGQPPFHVVGPAFPPTWDFDDPSPRFSLYQRAACWNAADVERLRAHADKVWSLELYGDVCDDDGLRALPPLNGLEVLQLHDAPLRGHGIAALTRHRRLRHLRMHLRAATPRFTFPSGVGLAALESIDVDRLPSFPFDVGPLAACGTLRELGLGAVGALDVVGQLPPKLRKLRLSGTSLGRVQLPRDIESLSLRFSDGVDVGALLAPVIVRTLHLRGTRVPPAFLDELAARRELEYADLVDTGIDDADVRRLMQARPDLKLLPNLS